MILKPRKGFSFIVKFIDFFNPLIVLLSIAGLILEYTRYKDYVLFPNRIIDMIFVVDFLLRLISFPSGRYFFKSYGWVDFLASIPGFTAFMQFGQYFGLFKVMRIGRFFKIIRVLRFLRIFSFLKKMKGDSAFIQERIMKIGVTIVIVFVTGLGFTDYFITRAFMDLRMENINSVMELSRSKVSRLSERLDNVVYYSDNGVLYNSSGQSVDSYADYTEKLNSMNRWYIEVRFSDNSTERGGRLIPVEGILVSADDIMFRHDNIMLILISSLIMILVILIFYIGYIFARDMKIVQLINDSVDAEDYWLLKEEAKKYSIKGDLVIEEGEDEIISLIKMAAKLAENAESSAGSLPAMDGGMFTEAAFTDHTAAEDYDLSAGSGTEENLFQEAEIPSVSDGNGISLYAYENIGGAEIQEINETINDADLEEFSDVIPDFSGFSEAASDTADLNIPDMAAEGMGDPEKDYPEEGDASLRKKLDTIEKAVNEINSKLSSIESVRDDALESVARDAASRAVKITSKSIGEYIHKKLSGG